MHAPAQMMMRGGIPHSTDQAHVTVSTDVQTQRQTNVHSHVHTWVQPAADGAARPGPLPWADRGGSTSVVPSGARTVMVPSAERVTVALSEMEPPRTSYTSHDSG